MRMRQQWGIAVVGLALLLAWWATRPVRQPLAADRPMPALSAAVEAGPTRPAAPADRPVNPGGGAKELAIVALAEASGRYAVVCPPPREDRDGTSWRQPEGATCVLTGSIVCAASQPAGSVVIRRDDNAPVVVYRWDTGPDGATTCGVEPPTEGRVEVRVVDPGGLPRAGVNVSTSDQSAFATTDGEGRATLTILGTGTHQAYAFADDGAVSAPASVVAGGTATVVLGDRPADLDPGEVLVEVRLSRGLEAVEDLEAALEGPLPPEVAHELGEMLDTQQQGLDSYCKSSDVPTCRAWQGR